MLGRFVPPMVKLKRHDYVSLLWLWDLPPMPCCQGTAGQNKAAWIRGKLLFPKRTTAACPSWKTIYSSFLHLRMCIYLMFTGELGTFSWAAATAQAEFSKLD